jgi:hypothetical protein
VVAVGVEITDVFIGEDANGHLARGMRVSDRVVAEHEVMVVALDQYRGRFRSFVADPVVYDAIAIKHIAMGTLRFRFVAEENTGRSVLNDRVAAKEIVRILVPYGDAGSAITADFVVLEQPVLDAPADVQPIAAVADRTVATDHRML